VREIAGPGELAHWWPPQRVLGGVQSTSRAAARPDEGREAGARWEITRSWPPGFKVDVTAEAPIWYRVLGDLSPDLVRLAAEGVAQAAPDPDVQMQPPSDFDVIVGEWAVVEK